MASRGHRFAAAGKPRGQLLHVVRGMVTARVLPFPIQAVAVLAVTLWGLVADAQGVCRGVHDPVFRDRDGVRFVEIGAGRVVAYDFVPPSSSWSPTFLLLPGLFRGYGPQEASVLGLQRAGFGTIRTATSDHGESLRGLEPVEVSARRGSSFAVADYAREFSQVIRASRASRPIAVSLSYSSLALARMTGARIFVAPLVRASDADPAAAAALKQWEAMLAWNPIFGPSLIRSQRDGIYRAYWAPVVATHLRATPELFGSSPSRDLMIEGGVALSRATESFDLVKAMETNEGPVDFLLAENESPRQLRGQIAAAKVASLRHPVRVVVVREAEHNLPDSHPREFVAALAEFARGVPESSTGLSVGVMRPTGDKATVNWLPTTAAVKLMRELEEGVEAKAALNRALETNPAD